MPDAFSTPNMVALPITSEDVGRGGFFTPPPPNQNSTINPIRPRVFDALGSLGGADSAPPNLLLFWTT